MAIFHIIDSFTAGKLTPELRGRTDLAQYQNGAETLQNFTIRPHGGVTRRTGTQFIGEVKDSSKATRLIPFQFSTEQAYVLELGDYYLRFYKDDGIILDETDFVNGDFAASTGWTERNSGTGDVVIGSGVATLTGGGAGNEARVRQEIGLGTSQYTVTGTTTGGALNWRVFEPDSTSIDISTISNANPADCITVSDHGYSNGDLVYISGVAGMTQLTDGYYNISGVTHNTFNLTGINSTAYGAYTAYSGSVTSSTITNSGTISGAAATFNITPTSAAHVGIEFENPNADARTLDSLSLSSPIYEIDTPWPAADIFDIRFAQSTDTVYMCHRSYRPQKLTRSGHYDWTLTDLEPEDGAYFDETDIDYGGIGTNITLSASGTSGLVTITASKNLFASTDVGRHLRMKEESPMTTDTDFRKYGWGKITSYTSPTSVELYWQEDPETLPSGTDRWSLGVWSDTLGWPGVVTFHEQRLWLDSSDTKPQTLWASTAGDLENFSPDNYDNEGEVDADTALTFTIASREANVIQWLESRNNLFIGTSGAVFLAKASDTGEAITPDNITIKPAVTVNSSSLEPLSTQNATLFIQRFGKKVMELAYFFEEDSWRAVDLTLLAEGITDGGVVSFCRQDEPDNIVWCVTGEGGLKGLTYLRQEKVVGWHEHSLGGSGLVECVMTIPGTSQDNIYMIVNRTIDGGTKRYIEKLTDKFDGTKANAWFLDCALEYSGSASDTITGLDHLEGETISVLAEGNVHPDVTVTSGSVTLEYEVTQAVFGYNYESIIQTFGLALPQAGRAALQSHVSRVVEADIRFYKTLGGEFGSGSSETEPLVYRSDGDPMDSSPPLFTGTKTILFDHGYDDEVIVYIKQDQPLPMSVLSLGLKIDASKN